MFRNLNTVDPGVFYPLLDGHILTSGTLLPGPLTIGSKINTNSMLDVNEITRDGEPVGWYFYSGFPVEAKGGYLVTYMKTRRGLATNGTLVLRHPEFVVFDIERCGSLAVSMKVNEAMENILMEQ